MGFNQPASISSFKEIFEDLLALTNGTQKWGEGV